MGIDFISGCDARVRRTMPIPFRFNGVVSLATMMFILFS